jgi:nucleoside-diphosphate-sugar epimerase
VVLVTGASGFVGRDARGELATAAALWRDPQPALLPHRAEPRVIHPAAAAASRPASNFEVFLVADGEQVSTPIFIERFARAAGKSSRLFGMSPELLSSLLGLIGRQDVHDGLIGSLELNVSKAIATGWQPQVSLDEGLRLALSAQDT